MTGEPPDVICGTCGMFPELHSDSDAGPMTVCPSDNDTSAATRDRPESAEFGRQLQAEGDET